ncbi:glycoside hydrolase family 18 protein [Leeia aquatica]|uniref:chitinase n=1 Tax=Leeia aquatica TaxID=2725557 RepID=A0A847SBF5_9NEIS|nr:glycoside hydrolase family 18 protein [Leeia aquatica]NLR74428.1 glycoside hydrolase family 18 protein [Leeia aquatica]
MNLLQRLSIALAIGLGCGLPAAQAEPAPLAHGKQVVAYLRTWPLGSRAAEQDKGVHWQASQIRGDQLTMLNISFALLRNGSEVYLPDLEPRPDSTKQSTIAPFSTLWDEVATLQQRYPHLKVNLSIGGWGADGFSDMAADPALRQAFINNVLKLVEQHRLAGVDIDWEYPVGPDWGLPIKTRPQDRDNFPALLEALRAALDQLGQRTGQRYGLSVAVPANIWYTQKNDVPRITRSVDYLKVMAYDIYGGWSKQTGHHTNLFQRPDDPAWGGWSAKQSMELYLNAGVPASKLLLGTAFYGVAWKGVKNENHGLFQPFTAPAYPDGVSWGDIQGLLTKGYTRYWDDVAKAPWLYNGDEMISYEDAESTRAKAAWAKQQGLAGIMVWEYGHNLDGSLFEAINQGLAP